MPIYVKPPDIRQITDYDCGRACLESLLKVHGHKPGPWLNNLANPVQGMAVDTVEAVLWCTFRNTICGSMTFADLDHYTATLRPVICPITYDGGTGHYVLVYRVNASRVYYHDPKYGPQMTTRKDFAAMWYDAEPNRVYRNFGLTAWPAPPRSKKR